MDKDRIKGKLKQAEGKAEDIEGDFTDSPEDDLKGKMKHAAGKAQEAWGKAKDEVRAEKERRKAA
jgi:uncharacterized protein YjbJ (UPF0337 family)